MDWDPYSAGSAEAGLRAAIEAVNLGPIVAIGHRVVHGGTRFAEPVAIDADVRAAIADVIPLAPLHNAPAMAVIDAVSRWFPGVPQAAVFDTAFHATLPPHAYTYAVPYAWSAAWGIRRFGFHGISHASCSQRVGTLLGRPLADLKIVSCHLGSGCSLAAIKGGFSIATTMGFTPLDGIVMATRPGAMDPGVLMWVLSERRIALDDLQSVLHHESGLRGIAGGSGDMREVQARRAAGDQRAALAFDVYIARLREGIAAMTAAMGGIDALAFTGGVGEHAAGVRAAACAGFSWIGIELDRDANHDAAPDRVVSSPDSRVAVLVVRAREEAAIARATAQVVGLSE